MGSYMQMGYHTENLIGDEDLTDFEGVILSPLNRIPDEIKEDIKNIREKGDFKILFDPQLYYPRTKKDKIFLQPYFPDNFESANAYTQLWWEGINSKLATYINGLNIDCIVSPVIDPKKTTDSYYEVCFQTANDLKQKIKPSIKCLTALLFNTKDLSDETSVMRLASMATQSATDGFYLVIKSELEPRREFNDESELFFTLKFIKALKNINKPIMVSFASSDMLLYKVAGADHCGTGKFFNLRRFTQSRFEEPSGGGGQLPYWFEHSLLAFIREADISRLKNNNFGHILGMNHSNNYWSNKILEQLEKSPGEPWLAFSWRHYLSWFCKTEKEISTKSLSLIKDHLKDAEKLWLQLEDNNILFEEPRNDGSWLRTWRQAILRLGN